MHPTLEHRFLEFGWNPEKPPTDKCTKCRSPDEVLGESPINNNEIGGWVTAGQPSPSTSATWPGWAGLPAQRLVRSKPASQSTGSTEAHTPTVWGRRDWGEGPVQYLAS